VIPNNFPVVHGKIISKSGLADADVAYEKKKATVYIVPVYGGEGVRTTVTVTSAGTLIDGIQPGEKSQNERFS
jgi:hypothetical protein